MTDQQRLMSPFAIWLWAFRPRTLPLAVSAIILGLGLAALYGTPHWGIFILAFMTALLLQILSNLANDYGDAVSGADNADRVGPMRVVGSGLITPQAMLKAVILAALLALCFGMVLVFLGSWGNWNQLAFFLLLGVAAIAAAIAYTMGKRPYGYMGLGDTMVLIFFGPVAVCGSAILCGAAWNAMLLLPGLAAGLCSTAVLNINNMRDRETDRAAGKNTVVVRMGLNPSRMYHGGLILGALLLWTVFWLRVNPLLLPSLVFSLPLLKSTWIAIMHTEDPAHLNPQLKYTSLGTGILNTGMGLACFLAA